MPILYMKIITRDLLRLNPSARFVFGDNLLRQGYGGQAEAMRGESNAIGIVTKRFPSRKPDAFFLDNDPVISNAVMADLAIVGDAFNDGRVVCVPADGIGTGLADLPRRAPKLYRLIRTFFSERAEKCPWPPAPSLPRDFDKTPTLHLPS